VVGEGEDYWGLLSGWVRLGRGASMGDSMTVPLAWRSRRVTSTLTGGEAQRLDG